jgi:hypothetical protein
MEQVGSHWTDLTLNPLTWKIWWAPNIVGRWQIKFNSAFKGLNEIWCLRVLQKPVEKSQVSINCDKNSRYFTCRPIDRYMYIYVHISFSSSYNEKCFGQKLYRKSKQTFCVRYLFPRVVLFMTQCEKYGKAREATDSNIIRRMHSACWINKATNTYSEYVLLNIFTQQQWLRERASNLHYTYIVCLV